MENDMPPIAWPFAFPYPDNESGTGTAGVLSLHIEEWKFKILCLILIAGMVAFVQNIVN